MFGLGEQEQDIRPSINLILNFNMYYRAWTELERDKSGTTVRLSIFQSHVPSPFSKLQFDIYMVVDIYCATTTNISKETSLKG